MKKMPTIAELQINVDSRPLSEATRELGSFADAANKASTAASNKQKADTALANATKTVASGADDSAKAAANQSREFEKLLAKIDPVTKKLNDLAKQEALLFANKDSLSTAAFDSYNAKLQESLDKIIGVSSAQRQLAQSTEGVPERLKAIANASVEQALAQQNLTSAIKGASEAEQGLVSSGAVAASNARAKAALEEFNARREATKATQEAVSANAAQARSVDDLTAAINPAIRRIRELEALQRELNQAQKDGRIDPTQYQTLNRVLETNIAQQKRYSEGLQNTGKSAKELAFATRGLPAQFTDIVVSLQGGQAPLTVLLQQGGQIKDQFGGVGAALKAMATYIAGLITPVTVLGTVLAGVAFGAYQGGQELSEFNKALVSTNGAAGVSASQFSQFRDTLDNTVGTAAKAAQALTALEASGQVAGDQFLKIAESAILFEKATGQAIEKTVEDFAAIGKDPVNAAVRLDEKYRFLTATVLSQADALVRQGNEQEAVRLLQDQLADSAATAATAMLESAGTIERAWRGVRDVVKEAVDAVLSIGRTDTSADRINELLRQRKNLQDSIDTNASLGLRGLGQDGNKTRVAEIDREIAAIKERINYENLGAENAAKTERARRESVSATASAERRRVSGLKDVAKAEEELRQVRLENAKILAAPEGVSDANRKLALENEARAVKNLAEEREKAAKKANKPEALNTTSVQEVRSDLKVIEAEYDGYYKRVTALGDANLVSAEATYASQRAILQAQADAVSQSYDAQINAIKNLRDNKKNTNAQNIALDNQLTKAQADRVVAEEKVQAKLDSLEAKEKGRIDRRTANISAYAAALEAQRQNLEDDGARRAEGVGRGSRQAALNNALGDNDRSFAKQQRDLAAALGASQIDPTEYAEKLKLLGDAHTEMKDQILKNDAQIQAANEDWTNGFTAAVEEARDVGVNFAGSVNSALTGAFRSAGDALAEFVTTGKLNFRSFTVSILADFARIASQQAASGALSGILGIAGSAASSYFGGGANGFSSGSAAATSSSLGASQAGYSSQYFKNGGGFEGGVQRFAKGGDFTNSIVSTPTRFRFGDQLGEMGEAGPEAILPLQRAADGSLGVRAVGGSGDSLSGGTQRTGGVQVNVYVTNDGTTSTTTGGNGAYDSFGSEIGAFVDQRVYKIINKESRSGGSLAR
jgi:lambda family phage tail tape measure protein